jgi:hypothetical protein
VAPSQVYELLKRANKNRSVSATKCNERSSRSHSVFQLRIVGKNYVTSEEARPQPLSLFATFPSPLLFLSCSPNVGSRTSQSDRFGWFGTAGRVRLDW